MHCFGMCSHGLQVWAADLYGLPVALKLPGTRATEDGSSQGSDEDEDEDAGAAARFLHDEAVVLEALRPLQGVHIPRLIAYGSIVTAVSVAMSGVYMALHMTRDRKEGGLKLPTRLCEALRG
jgi:hypothetical protein